MAFNPPQMFKVGAGFVFGGKAGAGPMKIESRIGIKAPAEVIWEIASDFKSWSFWNPTYTKGAGELRIGAPLEFTLELPGEAPQVINPVLIEWVPLEQIHWSLTLARGLVRTVRYIEIEALNEASCIVSNGEIFEGLLGPTAARSKRHAIRQGFIAMSEALAARAEAQWQGSGSK
ncbi:MAG: SRPBCC domain-containing protein [Alphaproteobacteria bacterium]